MTENGVWTDSMPDEQWYTITFSNIGFPTPPTCVILRSFDRCTELCHRHLAAKYKWKFRKNSYGMKSFNNAAWAYVFATVL